MKTAFSTSHAPAGPHAVDTLLAGISAKDPPAIAFVFASPVEPLGPLVATMTARLPGTVVIGASTSGEFTESICSKSSITAAFVSGDYKVTAGIGTGLAKSADAAVRAALEGVSLSVEGYPHRTAVLLLDPLAGNGEETTLIAASHLGEVTRLAGGAAGDDLAMKRTEVSCGPRCATDAVVIATIHSKAPLGVGVAHGHEPLSKKLRVTRATGNVVHTLDGRPAWDVWAESTRESAATRGVSPDTLEGTALFDYLLRYEAGLQSGDTYKIRAPLSRLADGSLSFACAVPEGAEIQITESVPERQVASAREAARRARAQLGGAPPAGAVVFDCICRFLILGEQFEAAVREISAELGDVPVAGFETYGEIALDAADLSGFHNTTTVVLAFPR